MIHASTSDDVHAQADLLQGWNQSYVQLSAGPFAGTLVETKLEGVSVFAEYTSQMLLQKGSLAKDVVAVGIPVKMPGTAVFCGGQYSESAVYFDCVIKIMALCAHLHPTQEAKHEQQH